MSGATDREVSSDNPFDAPPLTDIHHPSLTLESKLSTYSLLPYSDPPTTYVTCSTHRQQQKGSRQNQDGLGSEAVDEDEVGAVGVDA